MKNLWTPWRMAYIEENAPPAKGCIFEAGTGKNSEKESLLLYRDAFFEMTDDSFPVVHLDSLNIVQIVGCKRARHPVYSRIVQWARQADYVKTHWLVLMSRIMLNEMHSCASNFLTFCLAYGFPRCHEFATTAVSNLDDNQARPVNHHQIELTVATTIVGP